MAAIPSITFPFPLCTIIREYTLKVESSFFARLFESTVHHLMEQRERSVTSLLEFTNDKEREEACMVAGEFGDPLLGEALKSKGVSINFAQAKWKERFKAVLARQDRGGEILFCLDKNPDLQMWWHYALEYGHLSLLKTLQLKGCDVHSPLSRPLLCHRELYYWGGQMQEIALSEDVTYPITRMTQEGWVEAVKWLLTFEVRIDVQGDMEDTPFQIACAGKKKEHTEILSLFLNTGIDLNKAKSLCLGQTPLQVAKKFGNAGTIVLLEAALLKA